MLDRPDSKKPDLVDVRVGANIKQIRTIRGMSQERLGEGLGITFQQVQKYEKGTNRVSASKLIGIAGVLKVDVSQLFEGVGAHETEDMPSAALSKSELRFLASYRSAPGHVQNALTTLLRHSLKDESGVED